MFGIGGKRVSTEGYVSNLQGSRWIAGAQKQVLGMVELSKKHGNISSQQVTVFNVLRRNFDVGRLFCNKQL